MRRPALFAAALIFAAALGQGGGARAADKCDPANLAATLQERMKAEGRTNAEIQDVLGNNLKRKALGSRVAKASGCTSDQVNSALRTLETTTKG